MQYEDFRYVEFSRWIKNKFVYWVLSFVGLHIFPTLMIYFGNFILKVLSIVNKLNCIIILKAIIPTYYALSIPSTIYSNILTYLYVFGGIALSWIGLLIETIADE